VTLATHPDFLAPCPRDKIPVGILFVFLDEKIVPLPLRPSLFARGSATSQFYSSAKNFIKSQRIFNRSANSKKSGRVARFGLKSKTAIPACQIGGQGWRGRDC